jgi:hypothetical protein
MCSHGGKTKLANPAASSFGLLRHPSTTPRRVRELVLFEQPPVVVGTSSSIVAWKWRQSGRNQACVGTRLPCKHNVCTNLTTPVASLVGLIGHPIA